MKTTNFKTIVLEASEGMYITQVKDVELMDRLVVRTVALGTNSSESDYKEITEEEGKKILAEQESVRVERMNKFLNENK